MADYSQIPRLKWMGPGAPGTYEEYMLGRSVLPLQTTAQYASPASNRAASTGKALVLVNQGLQSAIQSRLNRYLLDLEEQGFTVEMYSTSGGTPQSLKTFILNHSTDLKGCVFIGDHPAAWFEMNVWGYEEFPCDLFYMDLDGDWNDGDGDGRYDSHGPGSGDVGPEIYVGRIDTSMMSGNEASVTNHYLDKNHNFRIGAFPKPEYGLTYTEDDWATLTDMRTSIRYAYPDYDDIPAPATERNDYVNNRVPSTTYEFIQLSCHSSPYAHYFTRGGQATNTQIQAASPHAMFYNLFCCSSLRFTSSNYLGGAYIYNTSSTSVAVIGSTKTGSMLTFHSFYYPLGNGKTFGDAFRVWINFLAPYDSDEMAWHYGMTVTGDPFLLVNEPDLLFSFPEGLPDGTQPPGVETRISLEISPAAENYLPGSGLLHYRFAPGDAFQTRPITSLGGDLYETVLPATQPGDEPQFYFSAEGTGGSLVTTPKDAPQNLFEFMVAFQDIVVDDSFETSLGWTIESTDVQAGDWERGDPSGTAAQPENDHSENGSQCYVTGLAGGAMGDNDLDGGPTSLLSPIIDLAGQDAEISFYVWFYHSDTGTQRKLAIDLTNDGGFIWRPMTRLNHNPQWTKQSFLVSDFLPPTSQVQIRITVADNPDDDVVEAAIDDFKVIRFITEPALWADAYEIPVSQGGLVNFTLDADSGNAFRDYLILGSMSGTAPGVPLPGGQSVLPLQWDSFTDYLLGRLNTTLFFNFYGTLDNAGAGTAQINVGTLSPAKIGKVMHLAFLLDAPFDFTSNAVAVEFVP